ncbi:MAG: tRNA (adenosine(37)-N6)-dimethylallyltransferase MiaA [bacterium]|nr:tRNA (adenosine(37)-N6)-dimethylallyltransferase MiaA [bacterium]
MKLRADLENEGPQVLVLAGPTASGKTELGIRLALALGGEVVSADARQVYRWLDIGTAKPTSEEQATVPHHMLDVADPDGMYSAGQYAREAALAIDGILERGKLPILVGGSGLYLEALFHGFSPLPEIPQLVRHRLQDQAQADLPALFLRLTQVDPDLAERIHSGDTQRIVRGLEVFETTGEPLSAWQQRPREKVGAWRTLWFGLCLERNLLYERINTRVDRMISKGLLKEVQGLMEKGYRPGLNALNTFGYRELLEHLEGHLDLELAVMQIKQGSRRYAKRQMTWFRRRNALFWVNPAALNSTAEILRLVLVSRHGGAHTSV